MTFDEILAQAVILDIETTYAGDLRHVGALFGDQVFEEKEIRKIPAVLGRLDRFAQQARFVIGHNLVNHDLKILQSLSPQLRLLTLPVINTLFLSPLAFPENPYHRLVKDYKLVRAVELLTDIFDG